jgi:hypothetical protein
MVMTDGRRQYLEPAVESLIARVHGPISRRVLHDDSGDPHHRQWLTTRFPDWEVISPGGGRSGFCGAYASGWSWLARQSEPWVFQTEDDFTYETDIDLDVLLDVMTANLHIAQMQLRRQPWGTEPADGGFVGQWPHFYRDATDGEHHWLEHRRNWSTNPGLFRRALCERPWPGPPGCEGTFGDALMAEDPDLQFALWGQREDPPTVFHIGHERIGNSY